MEAKKIQHEEAIEHQAKIVPMRTYRPKSIEQFQATLEAEAKVGRGRALVRITIAPALASAILEHCNVGNRPVRGPNLRRYVKAMSDGRWGESTIMFGVLDGHLRVGDAQHRLLAVRDSGTEQSFDVRVYTEQSEFESAVRRCDEVGTARTLRDLMVIEGLSDAGHGQRIESIVNAMVMFDGTRDKRTPLSNEERLDYASRKLRSLLWSVKDLPRGTFKPHVAAALVFCHLRDAKATAEFASTVAAGEALSKGSAAHTMLQQKEALNAAKGESDKRRAIAVVIRLVSNHRDGRKTATRVDVMCDATKAAVERAAGKVAWSLVESIRTPKPKGR